MCGICGIIDWQNNLSQMERQKRVAAMNHAILHRGPDEGGEFSSNHGSLAMRRLSIIDTAGGTQPIFNETQDICIFFNGEIYNYKELKAPLIEKGHQFKTESDTETLVHLYEEYGLDMLPMLKGMFTFCIYDQQKDIYLLARDRFGEKPLYYHHDEKIFSFSSEVKSLLENPSIERKLNHTALPYYLRTSLVPEPITLLDGVQSLLPGHYMILDENKIEEKAFFTINYTANPSIKTEAEAIEFIQPKLMQAVQHQTVSDVPIGAFLSGGIDSSTVVALLQQQSSKKIKTFNVRFENQVYDESPIAKKVAEYYDTDHHEVVVPNLDFDESIFWTIIDHVGLPFRDSSAIPSYFISKEISQYVKVALSGDGGDELFGGYDLFEWYRKIIQFKKIPSTIRSFANMGLGMAQHFPLIKNASLPRKIRRGIRTSLLDTNEIPIALNEMFESQQVEQLLNTTFDCPLLKEYPKNISEWSALRNIMYYRLKHTLTANMLIKVDRMSMANSLEVRAPFLDSDLFDASLQLPDHLLINNGQKKYIIRKIMEKKLPPEVFNHPKQGFNIPLHQYQNEAYQKLAQDLLFENNPWKGFFAETQLQSIYDNGISKQKNSASQSVFQSSHQLWMMMQLLGWAKRFKVKI
ncbi:MAG: asparagine synthase (glutamine-hydrolyzing) [Maribacter sp.]|jgi:asparagine synthase (glutamine-hydrolysing)